jgi:nicotinate phosphoribosyltransferase
MCARRWKKSSPWAKSREAYVSNLAADSSWARARLDQVGWKDVIVFASGDLDEDRISSLLGEGAKIDGFGVGTALVTSNDSPTLGVIYKLVEIEIGGEVRSAAKFSAAKVTYPGRKQVYRFRHPDGNLAHDVIGLMDENFSGAETLLEPVMMGGKRILQRTDLDVARTRCLQQRARLPEPVRDLNAEAAAYPVRHSEKLEALLEDVRRRVQHTARS